jgi:hypothetical protein
LNVDGHELCGSRAALQEFTVRVARLNNRNTDPEGFNFLRCHCSNGRAYHGRSND